MIPFIFLITTLVLLCVRRCRYGCSGSRFYHHTSITVVASHTTTQVKSMGYAYASYFSACTRRWLALPCTHACIPQCSTNLVVAAIDVNHIRCSLHIHNHHPHMHTSCVYVGTTTTCTTCLLGSKRPIVGMHTFPRIQLLTCSIA